MHRRLYSCLLTASLPLAFGRLLWRSRHTPAYRRRWAERLGFAAAAAPGGVWLHAVSVGEVNAALPLIVALQKARPELPLLVTTTTPTGSAHLRSRVGDSVAHCYLPYDLPGAVRRFLGRQRPRLGIILETELWPNLYATAQALQIPLLLANARLSPRSARGYGRWPQLTRQTLERLAAVGAQTAPDGERLLALGLPPRRLTVTGNLKFDAAAPNPAAGLALRQRLGEGRPVWLAASTHAGEEQAALAAHRRLRAQHPEAVLILAPRHPQRFAEVARLCREQGWATALRSADDGHPCAVYLADSLGELPSLMAAADIVFVGGSLGTSPTARGGHNLIEPAQLGKPSLFGPHMNNFAELRELVLAAAAGQQVANDAALAAQIMALLADPARRAAMGQAAQALVAQHRGATARTLALINPYLEPG
ncbi:lipid IV(A) 3-deoxy-D-manno-octulosonic acid transferase [Immundisolibacter sp.]|uniref:lipid IV(A) 3-deoxy-D-manno-octulosonic acid transferase n=1 Tax=Immundisolibacter sp. TaxID=1934948 RepID=UPI002B27A545|nr:lipid IV(A) 3-deoxy-D-manno-octulosonic acid transferase [Immundisolibacter sp.]